MNRKLIGAIAFGVMVTAASLPAVAQGPGGGGWGGRRGGTRGGWGGPGGFGQRGPGGMFGMMGAIPNHDPLVSHIMELINRSDVQTEIHLDIRQKSALTDYRTQSQQMAAQQMGQFFQNMRQQRQAQNNADAGAPVDRNTQRQQFREQMQNQRAQIENKITAGLNDILRPDQQARLHQLDLQWRGVLSIADPKVADEVQVSQEHRTAIVALAQEYQTKVRDARQQAFQAMRAARQGNNGPNQGANPGANATQVNPQALFASIQRADDAARKDGEDKALALLSEDEKASWTKVQGKPFVFRQGIQAQ